LEGIALSNYIDTVEGIKSKLVEHYQYCVISQLYTMFGSLNIIGNPINLFRNITTGITDMKWKSGYGFFKGPYGFGRGLKDGTRSFMTHSIGGVLNAVEKVTGTVASGLAVLTFDREFEAAREREKMEKPQHVLQGLEQGTVAVFHGIRKGITGVFAKPIK
jgi:vacuolar protein sorting-associated protein 13A/C